MTVRMTPKYTETDVKNADRYITDPQWVMEQKMDGTRGLVVITPGNVWWPGSGGRNSLSHTAAIQHFPVLNPILQRLVHENEGELVLDGEIMIRTGEFHVFDLPYMRAGGIELIRPTDPLWRRREVMESLEATLQRDHLLNGGERPVRVVRQARTTREKAAMWARVVEAGVEGAMVKHVDSTYQPGVRVKDVLKLKLVKTADVVVWKTTRTRNDAGREVGSFYFGVYEGGEFVKLGSCSAIGKPETAEGDVIEVAYLYREPGEGALVQPRMVQVRTDKDPMECGFAQFPRYSRDAV